MKHYKITSNSSYTRNVVVDSSLTRGARMLFVWLMANCLKDYVSHDEIQAGLRASKSEISGWVTELQNKGYLTIKSIELITLNSTPAKEWKDAE